MMLILSDKYDKSKEYNTNCPKWQSLKTPSNSVNYASFLAALDILEYYPNWKKSVFVVWKKSFHN